jgi:hypothetical protein
VSANVEHFMPPFFKNGEGSSVHGVHCVGLAVGDGVSAVGFPVGFIVGDMVGSIVGPGKKRGFGDVFLLSGRLDPNES